MKKETVEKSPHRLWAEFRYSVIGQLLASPPGAGELAALIRALAEKTWRHPLSGEDRRFEFSTIEGWYYAARKAKADPVGRLRSKTRSDLGKSRRIKDDVARLLLAQYAKYPYWSYQLHADNLRVEIESKPLGAAPSYPTVRRYMKATGYFKHKKPRNTLGARDVINQDELQETRSYEAECVNALWHLDFHKNPMKVLVASGNWEPAILLGIFDDYSRLCCHMQWYLQETAECLAHGFSQAVAKRLVPTKLMNDNGAAMISAEFTEGLARLGVIAERTRPRTPKQNGKCEVAWVRVEGRLMAMLEGQDNLSLKQLNDITQAWVEMEYNRVVHDETKERPIDRFARGNDVGRPCPPSATLRFYFQREVKRVGLDLEPLAYPQYVGALDEDKIKELKDLQARVEQIIKTDGTGGSATYGTTAGTHSPRVGGRGLLLKAKILAARHEFFAANQALAAVLKSYGADRELAAEASLYAGIITPATADVDAAIRALRQVAADYPENRDTALRAARVAVGLLEPRSDRLEALVQLRVDAKGVPLVPALAHLRIAELFMADHKESVAANELRQIVDLYPESPEIMLQAAAKLSVLEEKAERYDAAESMLRQLNTALAQSTPENQATAKALLIDFLLNRGEGLLKQKEPGMATKEYEKVLALEPLNVPAHRGRIDAAVFQDHFDDLEKRYRDQADEHPDSAEWTYFYGYVETYDIDRASGPRSRLSAINHAIATVEEARELNGQILYIHQTLGWLYMQRNFTEHQYQRSGFFGSLDKRFGLVEDFFGSAEPDWRELAIDAYQNAYFLSRPESLERAALAQNLGVAYFSMNNFQKSLDYYLQRVKLLPVIPMRDPRAEAIVFERAGRSAFQTDELELAEDLQKQAVSAWERVNNDQRIAYSLDALALTLRERSKFTEAADLYERLWRIQERIGQQVNLIGTLSNLGYCAFMNNQTTKALEYFAQAEAKLVALEQGGDQGESQSSDAIKVDLGGGGSAAKGFDLLSRRLLLLTFRAKIYEKLARPDLAIKTYEEKLKLLIDAGGDKRARAEEIAILENNLGELQLKTGFHTPARSAFSDAEKDAKTLRASDQKDRSPAELTNRLNRARVELRLASLGLLPAADVDAEITDLDATAGQLRPAFKGGAHAQGKPLAQVLDLSSAFKATKPALAMIQADAIKAQIEETLGVMKAINAPPEALTGPLLTYQAFAGPAPKDAEVGALLVDFRKRAATTGSLEWKVLAAAGEDSKAFEALDRFLAVDGSLPTPSDRHLAHSVFDNLLRQAWLGGDQAQIGTLMRRFALLRTIDLARRGGMDKSRISKLLTLKDTAKVQAVLGDHDAILLAHRSLSNQAYLVLLTKKDLVRGDRPIANGQALDAYAALLTDPQITALLPGSRVPGGSDSNLYIVPDDELYDLNWEAIKVGGQTLGSTRTLAFMPTADLLPNLGEARRLAKASVAYLNTLPPPDTITSANSSRDFAALALDGAKPISEKLASYDLVHVDLPFYLNDVEPAASAVIGGGNGALAYQNDLSLRTLAAATLPSTASLILTNVQHNNVDLQPSGEGFDGWAFLSVAALGASVPTVLVVQEPKQADWAHFYQALTTMSVAEAAAVSHLKARLLGSPGVPAAEEEAFAKSHLAKAIDEAEDAKADQDFAGAAYAYKRALYYAQRLGNQKAASANLKALVGVLFLQRDYAAALHYQLRIAAALKPPPVVPGKKADDDLDPVDYAAAAVDAAVLAVKANQFAQAAALLDDADTIYTGEGMSDQLGKVWQYRAINLENQGKYDDCLLAYKKSQEFYAKRKPDEAANQLLNIGNIYNRDLSDNVKALDYYAQAAAAFQKMGKPDLYVPVLIDKANTQIATGELETAIQSLETEVIPKINLEKQRVLWVRATQILANAYYRAGLFQKAKDLNERTLAEADKIDNKLTRVNLRLDAMSLTGMVLAKLGHYEEAFREFHDGIALAQDYGLKGQIALLYNNYGFWARDYGAVDQSIDFFNTASRLDNELKSRSGVAFDNRNMGLSIILKGDYNRARDLLKQALKDSEELHQVYNAAYCQFGLGDIAMREKHWSEAQAFFQQALAISERGFMQDFIWRANAGIAAAMHEQKHQDQAELAYAKAVKVIESMRAGLQSDDSRSGFFSDVGVQEVYASYAALLMELGRDEEAWNVSERSRSRAFVDALGGQKRRLAAAAHANSSQLAAFDHVSVVDKAELASLVGADTAVVEYHITTDKLLIWVIKGGVIKGKAVAISAKELTGKVRDFRELMENYSTTDYLGKELAAVLLEPVRDELAGAKRLAIVPHDSLHFLPFAALPLASDAALIDGYPVFYLESATVARYTLATKVRPFGSTTKILAYANPTSDEAKAPLPFADKEVSVMDRYFPQRRAYFGGDATKARLLANLDDAEIVHLAAHGEFLPHAPSESRLFLAADGKDSGDLTVEEMFTLPLKANMVTLSACNTGLGKLSRGDEIVGMDRALFYAGASTVVTSLWRISDVASAVTMKRFYRYLAAGEDKAEAMRHAQLIVRQYFGHPAYWSSFRVLGDYR